MCGIIGVVSDREVDRSRLSRGLDTLASRGPDDRGCWWSDDGRIGIGHARLAINDPEGGQQPVSDGRFVCAVNGEFYGLSTAGRSDSHLLPQLCQGDSFAGVLRQLRGEFALLVYDQEREALFVARDRFGIKPLVWTRHQGQWWFASKSCALWAAGLAPGWSEESFWHACATQYPPTEATLFKGIQSLAPATWARLEDGNLSQHNYWQVPSLTHAHGDQEFSSALEEAVRLRLRPNETTAIQLSAGVDSASILALAHQTQSSHLHAFSVDFPSEIHQGYSEAALAASFTEELKLEHTILKVTPAQILEELPKAAQRTEGLFVNGHGVAKFQLARAVAKSGIKVVLSGEGADELLFGYRHFQTHFPETPQTDPLQDPAGLGILTSTNQAQRMPRVEALLGFQPGFFSSKLALGRRIQSLLHPDFLAAYQARDAFLELVQECPLENLSTPLELSRALWLNSALRAYILEVLGDGCEMAHSVEGRPPFLDHRLWEVGLPTPLAAGEKAPLRLTVEGLVPDQIRLKPKHPFMAPPLGGRLLETLRQQIQEREHPFVERAGALNKLSELETLSGPQAWEWEPALLWVLSSYYLQELWA